MLKSDMGKNYFPSLEKLADSSSLQSRESRLRGLVRNQKRNILASFILVSAAGLFFSVLFKDKAMADKAVFYKKEDVSSLDPFQKIGRGLIKKESEEKNICKIIRQKSKKKKGENFDEERCGQLVKNHPIETMLPEIAKREKNVAAFLIGIAKKESNWGKHSPRKNGRDCYNYWGYRGGYNATDSGYSCFDNPEQAVDVVGKRIEKLIDQQINTPERMIIWKCGSSCASHNPKDVEKWISDVSLYYDKARS